MLYGVIASATSDYNYSDIDPLDLEQHERDERGMIFESFSTLDEARAYAVEHCGEWYASNIESLTEDLENETDKTGLKWVSEQVAVSVWEAPRVLAKIAVLNPGEYVEDISCPNAYVTIIPIA